VGSDWFEASGNASFCPETVNGRPLTVSDDEFYGVFSQKIPFYQALENSRALEKNVLCINSLGGISTFQEEYLFHPGCASSMSDSRAWRGER